jgi:hypothetical protein
MSLVFLKQLDAIHAGHSYVADDHQEPMLRDEAEGFLGTGCLGDGEAASESTLE